MRILFIGDVVGKIGRRMIKNYLPGLKKEHNAHFTIVNGENAAHGKGITESTYKEILNGGADFITLGNHAFAKRDVYDLLNSGVKMVRPANFPEGTPGDGSRVVNINGKKLLIVNLQARSFLEPIENPFTVIDKILEENTYDAAFVDFHSETTSESIAMGYHLDGRVNAVVGTHTHVQTNDAARLPNGTVYITDVGMTGFKEGILGIRKDEVIRRFITNLPERHVVPDEGKGVISGVIIDTDKKTIKNFKIEE
ncbi:TIGR00282 family metallophosphoesterase [Jeotgalicoccus sp. FSL K6-3177]|uniref:TIGR00282 family metallophosphoesterase n=1 Tax=Jeotgalicoccus sp. FSL K6-3177 TaxID=2921494 RepID=UPI0030FDCE79